jgi:predicted O-methyltransferase YrrM
MGGNMTDDLLKLWQDFKAQTSLIQADELYNAVLNTPPGAIIEVGSATGGTTIVLIHAAKQVNKMVYSIDPYPEELEGSARDYYSGSMCEYKTTFKSNILNGSYDNIIQINEDLKDCIDRIPEISVAFIDGLHEFENVKKEYELLWPKLVKGGIMYFHDMGFDVGQLTEEGALTKFPEWVKQGEYVQEEINTRLEELQQMLKIVK